MQNLCDPGRDVQKALIFRPYTNSPSHMYISGFAPGVSGGYSPSTDTNVSTWHGASRPPCQPTVLHISLLKEGCSILCEIYEMHTIVPLQGRCAQCTASHAHQSSAMLRCPAPAACTGDGVLHHGAIFRTELTRNVQWSWSFETPSARICVCGVTGTALSIDTHHPTHHAGYITPKMWSVMEPRA